MIYNSSRKEKMRTGSDIPLAQNIDAIT